MANFSQPFPKFHSLTPNPQSLTPSITPLATENNTKEGKSQRKAKGISNNNAKIPTYRDSFEVKSTKAKGKRQKEKGKRKKAKGKKQRPLLLWIEIATAFGLAMTLVMITDN